MPRSALAVTTIYTAGLLQGFAFVLIPALGTLLKGIPYHLSATDYGSLFLPMTAGAILSALTAGALDRRLGANGVFRLGLVGNALALILLVGSVPFAGHEVAYAMLLAETALLGLGFGFNLSAINHLAAVSFPRRETAAVTLLNAVIGGSTALSPLILNLFEGAHHWWLWPMVLIAGFATVLGLSATLHNTHADKTNFAGEAGPAFPLWMFALAVLIYAVVEGSFGSWAALYVSGSHRLPAYYGAWALSAFWGAMTLFRLVFSLVPPHWAPPRILYRASPVAIAACFLALPFLSTPWGLIGTFAGAGTACSIYYPYSMSFALQTYARRQTQVAGLLVAALMAGEGIGSYALGPLQSSLSLARIYGFSALWGLPLLGLAYYLTRHGAGQSRKSNGPDPVIGKA
ncbi:MAG: MFS transporter [Gammaproteobacteria bacterium]|nr:MFS transporter [Gammaproteobacteria bacterium]